MTQPFDIDQTRKTCTRFLTGKLLQSGLKGFIVGLSGGIDSSLAAALAVAAAGPEKVLGVMMPYKTSSEASLTDARKLIEHLGIEHELVEISPMIDAYYGEITPDLKLRAGNKMARERMSILFDLAHKHQRLVLGTGNRTEICLGYTTWYGDSACSLNPVGDLYKTEVRALSRAMNIPESIITKAPSADLWTDQTDEGEIGVSYETIDQLLRLIVDEGERSIAAMEAKGFAAVDISRVVSLMNRNAFKRSLPDIAPLGKPGIPSEISLAE
ncbi:MAG TPA: NAD+ synthase [candidate division Zixibacteria bacterium]|nr:NAD+ synthase [candidate division Zixibacteria bacterium]